MSSSELKRFIDRDELREAEAALLLEFPKVGSEAEGFLAVAEAEKTCPFSIKRTYWVYGCSDGMKRGGHAHHNLHQILICVAGEVSVMLHDGLNEYNFILNRPTLGLYQKPMLWGNLVYQKDSVLLVLASEHYLAEDYIRDYQEFLAIATKDY
jgi:hypothetical protein